MENNSLAQAIYEEWLDKAVEDGRIHIPGYFDDPDIRRTCLETEWISLEKGLDCGECKP